MNTFMLRIGTHVCAFAVNCIAYSSNWMRAWGNLRHRLQWGADTL